MIKKVEFEGYLIRCWDYREQKFIRQANHSPDGFRCFQLVAIGLLLLFNCLWGAAPKYRCRSACMMALMVIWINSGNLAKPLVDIFSINSVGKVRSFQ